jgi:ABC-type glycerol-3-phosphate transport system substrate-binding protein
VVKNKELQPTASGQAITYTQQDRINESWKYIKHLTAKPIIEKEGLILDFDPTEKYLENTNKPAARKDLIEKQKTNPDINEFALQALTAKSWSQPNSLAAEEIFIEMISEVVSGAKTSYEALTSAEARINNLIK